MPTRISAGVGDHPCFLTFYNYDPISCKLLTLVCLLITIIISWRAPNKLLVENLLASMHCIHLFSAHYAVL